MGACHDPEPEHGPGDDLLILLLAALAPAQDVVIEAVVSDDLRGVTGTIRLTDDRLTLIDPLALLPDPPDDLSALRVFPGAPSRGSVSWTEVAPRTFAFATRLPRRYDDLGWTREGLLANGGWYPQPVAPGDPLPVLDWEVRLSLPAGRTGALGDQADQVALAWTGRADRASIAVPRRARLTALRGEDWQVALLTPGRPRRVLVRELEGALDAVIEATTRGVVVEGPLRRRLVRPGPGLAYVSDRAFRLTPPLQRFHRVAVAGGLAAALSPQPDPFLREIAGAAVARERAEALAGIDADQLLGALSWVPQVHWLLANERMPFYAEVLERAHPSDRVRDDLAEILEPHAPGGAVVAQLRDRFAGDAADRVGRALIRGATAAEAEAAADLPAGWLEGFRAPWPTEDWLLEVDGAEVRLARAAPADAPVETAIVRIDGVDHRVTAAPGETRRLVVDGAPRSVVLDPEGHLRQTSRLRDAWPERYMVTLSAGITSINATRGRVFGAASISLRRAWDTHNLYRGLLYNSFSDLVGARVSWLHQRGPQRAGWSRPHQLTTWTATSLLNPGFAATDGIQPTVGAGLAYAWDTRVAGDFPLRGHRVGAGVSAGVIPALDESWAHVGPTAVAVVSPHPRHAVALLAEATAARANVSHRKLALGGHSAMRSLPALPACVPGGDPLCQPLFDQVAMAAVEYRFAPLRNVSVPLPFAWGSELQVALGLEGAVAGGSEAARVGGVRALGATAGLTGIADLLGAEPYLGGITVGWPLAWRGLDHVDQEGWPEIYLRWSQEF